ncbi:MAG: hypothetical protein JNN07_18490 [Verrucomicrobiales bacterium]|nr:hypothetical protein [Verrucomicrobiales bacterium]
MAPKPQANRRVRLLLWRLFNKTPLALPIDTKAEQDAARAVRMDWETYERLKAQHPELWAKAEAKRTKAVATGSFPPYPPQLARARQVTLPNKRKGPEKLARRKVDKHLRRLIHDLKRLPLPGQIQLKTHQTKLEGFANARRSYEGLDAPSPDPEAAIYQGLLDIKSLGQTKRA